VAETFGEMLRRLRVAASLTQEALGERARLSADTIAALEQGRRRTPRLSTLSELADALALDPVDRAGLVRAATGTGPSEAPDPGSDRAVRRPPPAPFTPLVGRHVEVAAIAHELGSQRFVTLTGPGGVGKTRVAIEVARVTEDKFDGGTWWVELSMLEKDGLVADAVLSALGASEQPGRPVADQIMDLLPQRPSLVVLDNCEHVLDQAATLVAELLHGSQVTILATSRELLGLPGEVNWPVPALAVPGQDTAVTAKAFFELDSVELFVDRASRADPGFRLTDENAGAIGRVCARLEGIPLAIELTAVRVRSVHPDQLAGELEEELSLSASRARGVPERQSTLWASVDWSYRLLSDDEQRVFRCLAGFSGSFTGRSVEAVAEQVVGAGRRGSQPAEILSRLEAKSLVSLAAPVRAGGTWTRYRLLETIRAYAVDRADESAELVAIHDAHADHCLVWLSGLDTSDPTDETLGLVEAEWPNIRAAISWSSDQKSPRAARMVSSLGSTWHLLSKFHDAVVLGDAALDTVASSDESEWAKAAAAIALARVFTADVEFLRGVLPRTEEVASRLGDDRTRAWTYFVNGTLTPFDEAKTQSAYELALASEAPSLAAVAAAASLSGGASDPWIEWEQRIASLATRVETSSVIACCDVARVDALNERGSFGPALDIALHLAYRPNVMPAMRRFAYGRLTNIAMQRNDQELADIAEEVGADVARVWPTGESQGIGLQLMKLGLIRGEEPGLPNYNEAINRMGMTPVSMRTVCRYAIDLGRDVDPRLVSRQASPPAAGSLLEASINSVDGAVAGLVGDEDAAVGHWSATLRSASASGFTLLGCDALEAFAYIAARRKDLAAARRLLESAEQLRREIGYRFRFRFEQARVDEVRKLLAGAPDPQDVEPLGWHAAAAFALAMSVDLA
jgi:predicted ATPase/transcriptional regulator with XRE-family HTH domain